MTLIWAEGFDGDKALAPLWRRWVRAAARAADESLSEADLGIATKETRNARATYQAVATEAKTALTAPGGSPRTHAIIVGVGQYANPAIPGVTTSIRGAWAFAEWMLCNFKNVDRPLGSIEMALSSDDELGNWIPSSQAAARLGFTKNDPQELPVETATFANIQAAFERWLEISASRSDNAAFFYFSGHGLWKSGPLLLPEDAQLPTTTQPAANLIDIQQTEKNMFNTFPSIQCFFLDVCQEISLSVLVNSGAGSPLHQPTNAAAIPKRDAWLYLGSYTGQSAYGPADAPPYFTQELLACLERRGASSALDADTWSVTTDSLRTALEAACEWRGKVEKQNLQFSFAPGICNFKAELCQISGHPEVFVKVWCQPKTAMPQAQLYVESNGSRQVRTLAESNEWYVTVTQGNCLAGANFKPEDFLMVTAADFDASPPLHPVRLLAKPAIIALGGEAQ